MQTASSPTVLRGVRLPALSLLAAALLLNGCAQTLYFGTETSGGVKVSGTRSVPTNVSFAYQRGEIAVLPKGKNGETLSVFGGSDHDYSWTEGTIISQRFATGPAAYVAIDPQQNVAADGKNQARTMLFNTGTDLGIKLHLGESTGQSPSFLFGFRRAEAVIMPLADAATEANSVYADISIVYDSEGKVRANAATDKRRPDVSLDRLPSSSEGVRIKQRFATGQAAVLLVKTDTDARKALFSAAGLGTVPEEKGASGDALALSARIGTVTDAAQKSRLLAAAKKAAAEFPGVVNSPPDDPDQLAGWFPSLTDPVFSPFLKRFEKLAGSDLPAAQQ